MTRHLTEKELIEYQFKLADTDQLKKTADHLADCADCRQLAKQLKQKFSSLDLLAEDVRAPNDLIVKALAQAKKPLSRKTVRIKTPVWLSAAAAIILIALLFVVPFDRLSKQERQVVKEPSPVLAEDKEATKGRKFTLDADEQKPIADMLTASESERKSKFAKGVRAIEVADSISEKPPFAPASAIELVTLPRRDNVQITIYNSADLTLVREKRNLTLKKGWNWLQFMWANTLIDPTSLSLQHLEHKDKIDIQQLVFPAGLRELGRWLIRSKIQGQIPFEITYFTSGLSWRAFYTGTLSENEQQMDLQGYVRLTNKSGEDYENAQARLIVGKVHQLDQIAELARRKYPYNRPGGILDISDDKVVSLDYRLDSDEVLLLRESSELGRKFNVTSTKRRKEIKKEGLSEYFLYTIEGTETIPDKWGKRLLSFDVNNIDVNSLYKYDEDRWGKETIKFISFVNDDKHNLGQTPIPNGSVKIYRNTANDHLSYVGGTDIKYIPVDEEIELNLGSARLVTVEPVLMDFKTDNYLFDPNDNIAGFDEIKRWDIKVTNTRDLPADIEITRNFKTPYWIIDFSEKKVSYEKYDATHARFKLRLPPQTKQTFTYTVTTYHGLRQKAITEKSGG